MVSLFKKNLLLVAVILVSVSGFLSPRVSEAKSVSWNKIESNTLISRFRGSNRFLDNADRTNDTVDDGSISGWQNFLDPNSSVTVAYSADIYNEDTGTLITDGANVPVGTRIRFQPKSYQDTDISWFGTGRSSDSPNGHWISNAAGPNASCDGQDYLNDWYVDQGTWSSTNGIYAPLSINPPSNTISTGGTASLSNQGGGVYLVNSPGSITGTVSFGATYGKFYSRYYDYRNGTICHTFNLFGATTTSCTTFTAQCYGDATPLRSYSFVNGACLFMTGADPFNLNCPAGVVPGSPYQLDVPAQTISFNLTATPPANQSPTAPSISGPASGYRNTPYAYDFNATDPDGDQIVYGIDLDMNGTDDVGSPYGTPVNSGTTQNISVGSFSTLGTHTFQARTWDTKGAVSGWTQQTINIINRTPSTPSITGPTSGNPSTSYNFDLTASDPDGDQVKYNIDWDNNGSTDASTGLGASGASQTVSHSWGSAGTYTFKAQAQDAVGGTSGWASYTITINAVIPPPIPVATIELSVNNGAWTGSNTTINVGDSVKIRWASTNATTCTGTNVNTSNAANNATGVSVTAPTAGNNTTYSVVCTGPGGSDTDTVVVTTNVPPPVTATLDVQVNGGAWQVNPTSVSINPGDAVVLRWNSANATACSATAGSGFAASGTTGTDPVNSPASNASDTFTINCTGAAGSVGDSVIVSTVNSAPVPPVIIDLLPAVTNTPHDFTIVTTDPNNDQLKYGITDATCTTVTQWLPGSGLVNSGVSQTYTKTWLTPGTYTIYVLAEDNQGARSACASKTVTVAAAPVTTATLTINGSTGPVSVAKNATVNLAWTSTNAPSCTKWGGAWGSGQAIFNSGTDTTVVTATSTYMVNCGGVISSVDVAVVNQTPTPPTVTYVSGIKQTNQTLTFNIQGTDPDNDNIYYEFDWNNDGIMDGSPTMIVPSGTAQTATHAWTTAGTQTFQARTVDIGGARSAWTQHSEIITASPPTATLKVSVNGGAYVAADTSIDPGDTLSLQWSSTDSTNCVANTGSGFAASGTTGTDPVNSPAPNTSDNFKVTCTGPSGSAVAAVSVTTRQKPNFNQLNMTIGSLGAFDVITGTYASVGLIFSTANDGGSATKAAAPYLVEMVSKAPISGVIPSGLNPGPAGFTKTVIIPGPISFGSATVKVSIDTPIATNGAVDEVTEGVADNTRTATLPIPPPDPGLSITADRIRVRNTETTTIRWNTTMSYAGLVCQVSGPSVLISNAPASGSHITAPITAKSEYTFSCTETTTGTVFKRMTVVETEGKIEEI
jgi:hypothetical protein